MCAEVRVLVVGSAQGNAANMVTMSRARPDLPPYVRLRFAPTLKDAMDLFGGCDAVVTNTEFPANHGLPPWRNGVILAREANHLSIPIAWVAAQEAKWPIYLWSRNLGVTVFSTPFNGGPESLSRIWAEAVGHVVARVRSDRTSRASLEANNVHTKSAFGPLVTLAG
jgi:hypothetical protein